MTDPNAGWSAPDEGPRVTAAPAPPAYGAPVGAPRPGIVPLRPLGLGELLDGAVSVIRRFPRPVLAASAVVAVVGAALQLLVTLAVRGPLADSSARVAAGSTDALAGVLGATAVAGGLDLLVDLVTGAVLTGVVTAVVGRAVLGDDTSTRQAWELVRPRLVPLLLVSLVVAAAAYGAFFGALALVALIALSAGVVGGLAALLLVPAGALLAVLVYVRWSLATAVVVLEKQPVGAALRRSTVLVARSFWRVLGVLLLAALVAAFVTLVLQLPFQLLGASPTSGFGSRAVRIGTGTAVVSAVVSALVATVVAPFAAGVRALLYVDRRMRAEGLDVALVAAAAGRS